MALLITSATPPRYVPKFEQRELTVSMRQLQEVRSLQRSALDNGRWCVLRKLRVR